jgi:hypothetical protein
MKYFPSYEATIEQTEDDVSQATIDFGLIAVLYEDSNSLSATRMNMGT